MKTSKVKKVTTSQLRFSKDKETAIKQAILSMKKGAYKATAIKVELEAQLDRDDYSDFWCEDYILNHVPTKTRDKTIFCKFYNDGSVDSECTVTVPIDHPEYILDYIDAFKKLVNRIGNDCNTEGAGMHICILNSRRGNYPTGNNLKAEYHQNFYKAVYPLLPALYFLGSCDYISRSLEYRLPKISTSKYSAIHCGLDCYEFRVFETCYNYPERFYDYLIVVANCLQFYSKDRVVPAFKGKIGDLGFPSDGEGVGRFYFSYDHIKALELGLNILKPSYKSIETLKKERAFHLNARSLKAEEKTLEQKWRGEWADYRADKLLQRKKYFIDLRKNYPYDCLSYVKSFVHNHIPSGFSEPEILEVLKNYPVHPILKRPIMQFAKTYDESFILELIKNTISYKTFSKIFSKPPPLPERSVNKYLKTKKRNYLVKNMNYVEV